MTVNMWILFGKIILMIGFGILITKIRIMNESMKEGLSSLLLKAILPVSILSSSSSAFSTERLKGFGITVVIAFVYYVVMVTGLKFLVPHMKLGEKARKIFVTLCTYANVGFIGIPLASELFGDVGLLYAIAFNICYNLTLFSVGTSFLSGTQNINLKTVFGNIAIIMSIIAMIIYVSPFRFPMFIQSSMSSIGSMMTPVSMMIIGYEIASMNVFDILKDKYSYLTTAIRMLVVPLTACIILSLFPIDSDVAGTCVLLMALPAGSFNIILGQEYGCDTKFAARVITQNVLIMVITLPIVLYVSQIFL